MGSETMKLPVIDFSNLQQETPTSWESLKTNVQQALEEFGCFEAIFDQIPLDLRKSTLDATKQVFDLPLEIKLRNRSSKPYQGYTGRDAVVPLLESFGVDDAFSPGKIESFTNLLWSEGNPTFSKDVQSFSEKLSELDKIVRRMVLESLGLVKYIDEHMDSTNYFVRFMKYHGPQSDETKLGLMPHTDKEFVTILYHNTIKGWEVLTKDGQWITPDPSSPNSFFVLIGDCFHAWTNGQLHAPYHRVMMTGDEARYSIALFSVTKPGYIIKAPPEMVDEDHPLLYKPFDPVKFMELDFYKLSQNSSPPDLKAYCGA